jgi:hypothetical protein
MAMAMVMTMIGNKAGSVEPQPNVDFVPSTASGSNTAPIAQVTFRVRSVGLYLVLEGAGISDTGDWEDGSEPLDASLFEVRATQVSGTTVSGTLNTWLSMSSDRQWSLSNGNQTTIQAQINVEIRQINSISNSDSINVSFTAIGTGV